MTPWHFLVVLAVGVLAVTAPMDGRAQSKVLEDRMIDLNITPIEPLAPPPLDVVTTTGARVSLRDVKGQAALVYFWATW
jgi:hypothetical protein